MFRCRRCRWPLLRCCLLRYDKMRYIDIHMLCCAYAFRAAANTRHTIHHITYAWLSCAQLPGAMPALFRYAAIDCFRQLFTMPLAAYASLFFC